jgi:hypothetical protein
LATNDPVALAAAMATVAGTVTFEFPLDRLTVAPEVPAAVEIVILQLAEPGAVSGDGEQETTVGWSGGATAIAAC